ncbi:hypothetical protein HAX54_013931 [Datura stramonium]|uniref:Uncharacterized protein n=1 Tax=Datura stramonium TaxID=4076 RepID=A0ABS8TNY2_DATST|nr:hypothetical protein [Datura stramonium]
MKNSDFLDLYVVHVVNEAEAVEEDVGLTNLLIRAEIGERDNVSGGARAMNIGDINTDHVVEKDLDRVETNVESNSDSQEEDIPEEDDSKVDEELISIRDEKKLGTSSEVVVIVGSNIINTSPTNIDIGFKPPGLRWIGEDIETSSHPIDSSPKQNSSNSEERKVGETSNLTPSMTLDQSEKEATELTKVSKIP